MRFAVLALLASPYLALSAQTTTAERDSTYAAILRDVRHLASPALGGRATATAGADSAVMYLARRYLGLQIDPGWTECDDANVCRRSYFQSFRLPSSITSRMGAPSTARAMNVIAIVRGTDSLLSNEWVVVGAHHDHLGRTGIGALDVRTAHLPHLGADDNASGTAAVLALAERLANNPPRRSFAFVHFGAEELGLIGSLTFVENAPMPMDSIVAMVNLDMVGTLRGGPLEIWGVGGDRHWRSLLQRAEGDARFNVTRHDAIGPRNSGSDHIAFTDSGVPAIMLFTGIHPAYHTRNDTVDRLDVDGIVNVVVFAERLLRLLGDGDTLPTRTR